MLTFLAAIFIYTLLDISQLKLEVYSDEQDSLSRSMCGRRISQFLSVLMYLVLVVPLKNLLPTHVKLPHRPNPWVVLL